MTMLMTCRQIAEVPDLASRIIAGSSGQDREITWAHACEEVEPWTWLGDGHLVMTTGLALSADPDAQVEYLERSHAAGIVGVAVGEDMHAPRLSRRFLDRADELGFVVMVTKREVPWVAMAYLVADAAQKSERDRILQTVDVYETVLRITTGHYSGSALLAAVGDAVGARVHLVDRTDGHALLDDALAGRDSDDAAMVGPDGTCAARELQVPGFPDAVVRLVPAKDGPVADEPAVLQHLSLLAALELQRRNGDRERQLRRGSSALAHLVDGRDGSRPAKDVLRGLGLGSGPWVMGTCARPAETATIQHHLADRGVAAALLARSDRLHVLLPQDDAALDALTGVIDMVGISDPLTDLTEMPTTFIQSNLAFDSATESGRPLVKFHERTVSLLPSNAQDADSLVQRVLGPLLDEDAAHGSEYLDTLRVFLDENRSWTRASARLHIHKQTLVYRVRRITDLTGYRLDQSAGVATLWVALRTVDSFRSTAPHATTSRVST